MGVVDHDRHRRALGEVRGQPVEAVLRGEGPVSTARRDLVGEGQAEGRAAPTRRRRAGATGGADPLGAVHQRLEELADDPPRESALELPARGHEDGAAGLRGLPAHVGEERRLADARLALHDHQPATAFAGIGERLAQQRHLRVAVEEPLSGPVVAIGRGDCVVRRKVCQVPSSS